MEPIMISIKVLSTVAAAALILPMAAPTASFAQSDAQIRSIRGGGGGGFIPGAVAGAVIGGAIASQGYYGSPGYYAGPGYYAQGSYDDQYYDDGAVAVAPAPDGDDSVAYCMQTYRSYDPRSG